MLLGSIRNRVTRNTGWIKIAKWKKSYVQTVEVSWLISLGIDLKYFTLYAVFVKGALPPLIYKYRSPDSGYKILDL